MSNLTLLQQGSFTADGASRRIDLPGGANYFKVFNQTEAADTNDVNYIFEWYDNLADSEAFAVTKTGGGNTMQQDKITTGGFIYRAAVPSPEAAKVGTTITAADPAVCTSTAHGYAVGDRVRIYNNVAMKQIRGMVFTISAADANTFTLGGLDASGFAAAETAFSVRRLPDDVQVLPGAHFVSAVSQAANAVVEFSDYHNYKADDVIYFRCPSDFGMTELDGLSGKVVSVTDNYTVVIDIDSQGFSTFAFPASSANPQKFALGGLAGKRGLYDDWFSSSRSLVDLDPFREGLHVPYMYLPGGQGFPAGATSDVIVWQAYRTQ